MGLFSDLKQSVAMAKQAMETASEQARQNAAAGVANGFVLRPDGTYGPPTAEMGDVPPPAAMFGAPQPPAGPQPQPGYGSPYQQTPYPQTNYPQAQYPQTPYPQAQYPQAPYPGGGHPGSSPINFAALGAGSGDPVVKQRRFHPIWGLLTLVLFAGGIGALIYGIVDVVQLSNRAESEAVGRGQLNDENPVQFVATRSQGYTVYIVVDTSSTDTRDFIVSNTDCAVRFADGTTTSFSGSRQGTSTTIGDTSSVGYFVAPEGQVAVRCESSDGQGFTYFVSPGTNSLGHSLVLIFGGVGAIIAAVFCLVMTFRRRGARPRTITFST